MSTTEADTEADTADADVNMTADTGATVTVDGVRYELPDGVGSLLTVLREDFGVLAPKEGCGTGVCGACTVLVDGRPLTSCTMLAADAAGCEVMTATGLAAAGGADVARCLVAAGGVQCGFCSPGFVVSMTALLAERPDVTEEEARVALAGNLCRCTGYGRILAAVRLVQQERS